jgi:tRNA A-37 threonylcarbamoyl transferase component Bud32
MGKYEVLEELGSGAMGVVYKARDPIINRLVALKRIKANVADSPALLERFYREAQSAGSLQHPNIITIYEMGEEGGVPFIAMQLVDGQNLGNLIAQRAPIPLSLKLVYAVEACRAFAYAHKQGIIHRDIKPGNVMVSKEGAVKVVDFGIARVLENSKTQTGMLIGTFAYMPPEIFNGERADERSDIFSFGVLLYELFAYTRPFPGEIPASLMQSICMKEPIPLREVAPECPPELEAVVHRTLVKSVTERTQSMEDLLLELDPICKSLQAQTSADLVAKAKALVQDREFTRARELLVQALQVDFTNRPARALLDEVNADLKRILIRPKVEKHVNAGRAFLGEGRVQEAQLEAESALKLDSHFEPAEELLRLVQQEIGRAKLISEWLQASGERLAEGLPEEAEAFLSKIQEIDPANRQAAKLQEQVLEEKATRQRRIHLLETMQQARTLWMQQKYEDCIDLLTSLQKDFGDEEEVQKLLVTAREDRAEQHKRQTLERVRTLLAAGSYSECKPLLTGLCAQFPSDDEILNLWEQVRKEEAEQRKLEALKEARNLLAARCYEDCLLLLASLKSEFPEENEIVKLVESVHADQEAEQKEQGLKEARSLLASQRYDECRLLLTGLQGEFPADPEIPRLLDSLREEQAEQRRSEGLTEARKFLGSKQYAESLALLSELKNQFPDDKEIPALADEVRRDRTEQQKQQGLSQAQKLLASKQYAESLAVLTDLKKQFPDDGQIPTLADEVRRDRAEQQKLEGLSQARKLLVSKQYAESLALLSELKTQFPGDKGILKLADEVKKDQAEQQKLEGLSQARKLLTSKQYAESLALLSELKTQLPDDKEILRLADAVRKDQAEQQKQLDLAKARKLRASKQYAESLALLGELKTQFPDDKEIPGLAEGVRKDQAEQQKLQGLSEARTLLTSRRLEESFALLTGLRKEFPYEDDIARLLATVEQERAEQQKQQRLAEARSLLGSQQFGEALAVLEPLLAANAKDAGVLKLRALVLGEQEKVARSARLAHELQVLKKLVSDESYETVIARAGELLHDFANDADLVRLLEFARSRKGQVERERRLNHIVEEVQKFIASNQLVEAIAAARHGLTSFEGNPDLKRLLEQAESQRKKEFTRLQIQQQVREIKTKIHREEFSDAVRLAQDALSTLGPDTDLTQLLTSAQVECHARDKKRDQGRMLEKVRALLELGDLEGATLLLDHTIKNEELETADPRVERLSIEIASATGVKDRTLAPAAPESAAKEYAFLEGPPQIRAPEQQGSTEQLTAQVSSANQTMSSLPQSEMATLPQIAPDPASPKVEISAVAASPETRLPSHPLIITKQPQLVPLWKRPSVLTAGLLGLIFVASTGAYFLRRLKHPQESSQSTPDLAAKPPAKNLPETQQRDLISAAEKAIGQGDFNGAKSTLEQAKNINGPLNPAVDQKLGDVERAINNAATAAVLRQEETLWSQAAAYTQNGQFAEAQQALRNILKLPPEGTRKAEARQYLTEVIPRRQREEQMFAQAQQAMNGKDSSSVQQAADLFGEVAKLGGPRQQAALKNRQEALATLNRINALAALTDGVRQDIKRGDFRTARQKAAQLQQSGGDSASISREISEAEQARFSQLDASLSQLRQRTDEGAVQSLRDLQSQFQALADGGGPTTNDARRDAASIPDAILGVQARVTYEREEAAYQQAIQRYHTSANDKNALDASRSDFQSILKGGGRHAADAQKIVDEINARVAALSAANQPANPPKPILPADETPAVLAAVQRYADAFDRRDVDALRRVWPTMTPTDYGKFKISFSGASAIQLQVANEKVELGADGATAIVNTDITRSYTPKGEKPLVSRDHTVFHLVKGNGAWVIKDLQ